MCPVVLDTTEEDGGVRKRFHKMKLRGVLQVLEASMWLFVASDGHHIEGDNAY